MPDAKKIPALEASVPRAKAEGAFLALAAGDALGWPQEIAWKKRGGTAHDLPGLEFKTWTRRSGGRFNAYDEIIRAGEYSDDTQLTLAVARSRTNHGADWWRAFTWMELPLWTLYERGGGGATKRAARAWVGGGSPWQSTKSAGVRRYFDAGGNGVAMRVLPHALFLAGQDDPSVLVHDVVRDGIATHGHPRALVGATAYAYAAWSLARRDRTLGFGELLDLLLAEREGWGVFPEPQAGKNAWLAAADRMNSGSYERLWHRTVDEMRLLLEKARSGIRRGALADDRAVLDELGCFGRFKGAGTVTAAAAVYLASRHAAQPAQGVLRAAFERGADTDTLAAVTGGLLGCLAGKEWLPSSWLDVQDAAYLRDIACRIASGPAGTDQKPVDRLVTPRSILANLPKDGEREVVLGDSTRVRAMRLPKPQAVSKTVAVHAWKLRTFDGQTLYVTKVERVSGVGRGQSKLDSQKLMPPDDAPPDTEPQESAPASDSGESGVGPADALYREFLRQLRMLLEEGPRKRQDLEEVLGLKPGQLRAWLDRSEQNGEIVRVRKSPITFGLPHKPML